MAAPTLLVGLGGTGSKIVQRVRLMAKEHHMEDNLSYVVFDTDVNELNDIKLKTPDIKVVQTSTKQTVGQYLDQDIEARDNWFPVNQILNRKTLSEGAGQVRSISRLALNTAIKTGKMTPLQEAVESLYKLNGEASMQALRVILVGSLCGGTGSGLILPVSLYIRNFLTTRFQQNAAIIRGFFMLPEVFFEVIHGQAEQNNLKANAYAALRELDAFLMKADGSLDDKYDVHFMIPRAGSDENEEYNVSPMDFCFLYDAQNMDGNKQNSFNAYLDHAASCIYAQSIAPTSKRSNSSEDNVIRDLCKSGGRNRYCGAGSSMLIYPVDDVKEYLALTWLKDNVSSDWLKIDKQYRKEYEQNQQARRRGLAIPTLDRTNHYVTAINSGFDSSLPFEATIRRQCIRYDKTGTIEQGTKWDAYYERLVAHTEQAATAHQDDVDEKLSALTSSADTAKRTEKGSDPADTFGDWYDTLQAYHGAAVRAAQENARTIAYTMFHDDTDQTHTKDDFRIENWLQDSTSGNIVHPNAVRYFLCNLIKKLDMSIQNEQMGLDELDDAFRRFKTMDFNDYEDGDQGASEAIDALTKKTGLKAILRRENANIDSIKNNLIDAFEMYEKATSTYRTQYVLVTVLKECRDYVTALNDAMIRFYTVLDTRIEEVGHILERLESRFDYTSGQPTRYVCATKTCLRGLKEELTYLGDSANLPGDFTALLYNRCKAYALMDKKAKNDTFFQAIYDDDSTGLEVDDTGNSTITSVMGFWRGQVMAEYSSQVDMNVLDAMKKEYELTHPDSAYDQNAWKIYVQKIIQEANTLSKPFIESPLGVEPRTIPACCYNNELLDKTSIEKRDLVDACLNNNGGVADASIDRHLIVFYQAIYGLRANNLSKFAPPKKAQTYDRAGGEYYTSYFELVSQLNPDTTKSLAITPHIDRNWHVISSLPDLDEESELEQEKMIHAALFWGLLTGIVEFDRKSRPSVYRLRFADGSSGEMMVSNGTDCDNLYEVLDSFTISPLNVKKILEQVESKIERQRFLKKPINKSLLREGLDKFKLVEYTHPAEMNTPHTLFDIPMLMQKSKPADEYDVTELRHLMINIFAEVKKYLKGYFNDAELQKYYGTLLYNQATLFLNNMKTENELSQSKLDVLKKEALANGTALPEELAEWDGVYDDELFRSLMRLMESELTDCFMDEEADALKDMAERLFAR